MGKEINPLERRYTTNKGWQNVGRAIFYAGYAIWLGTGHTGYGYTWTSERARKINAAMMGVGAVASGITAFVNFKLADVT